MTAWISDPDNIYSVKVMIYTDSDDDYETNYHAFTVTDFLILDDSDAGGDSLDWLTNEYLQDYTY